MRYTCVKCGKQFDLIGKSDYCPECRNYTTKCVICGKEIQQHDPRHEIKTCSRKCAGQYRKISGISKSVSEKSLATKRARYGNGSGATYKPRKCAYCGKEFIPKGSKQIYCEGPHYGKCPVCGKQVEIKEMFHGPRACSEECRIAAITATHRSIDHTEAVEKYKQTCQENYGVDNYAKTDECKAKCKETRIEKFGYDGILRNPEVKARAEHTLLEKYGVTNIMDVPEIKEKAKRTLTEKYGGMGGSSPEILAKIEATCLERYGVKHPAQTIQCKEAIKATNRARYGFDYYTQSKERLARTILDPTKIDDFWEFREDPEGYVKKHFTETPYAEELAAAVGVNPTTVFDILINKNCKELIDRSRTSIIEREVYEFLKTLVPEDKIIRCDRRTIERSELDFYLPKYKFAIECDPSYTHNSTRSSFGDSEPKSTVYHRNKTNKCEEKGIFLMHIFGYDWAFNRPIIESMIRSAIGATPYKVYARTTYVKEVDGKTSAEFLSVNHRQGNASSPIRLGLFTKGADELVALMTFGKARNTIGKNSSDPEGTYELVRFCNKLNTSVVGGASKLFKWFLDNYSPTKVMSFSDRAHTKGNLYSTLGFVEVRRTDPGYIWALVDTEEYKTRVACQKHNLPKLFDDVSEEDLASKTEKMIMTEHGYVQVFDCGSIVWEYNPE